MANTQDLKNYLKMSDLTEGQSLKLLDAGEIKEVEFEDKKTKEMIKTKVLKFNVQIGSSMETKELTLNKISVKSLEDSLGPDTEKWAGQTCIVESVKTVQFGEIKKMNILTLTAWDAERKEKS